MTPLLYVKGSSTRDVRLNKFLKYFIKKNIDVHFIGWNRSGNLEYEEEFENCRYIFRGGGEMNKLLVLYYPIWMLCVFFHFLFKKDLKSYNIIAINFDTAFPIFIVSKFRKIEFTYEIYDQFALSYNFPPWLKKTFLFIDNLIMKKAKLIIHVDKNRVFNLEYKTVIIENTPPDFYQGKIRSYEFVKHKFAVIGLINNKRGVDSILKFAQENPQIEFLIVGGLSDITDEHIESINLMRNIEKKDFMPQNDLFNLMNDCSGIFSLYNPNIEINLLAASNKVYDAMMLGIPVITNPEVINSKFIIENELGLVVNYDYDESWDVLKSTDFVNYAIEKGKKARDLFLKNYVFEDIVEKKLLPHLN